jgi:hypothetical protein
MASQAIPPKDWEDFLLEIDVGVALDFGDVDGSRGRRQHAKRRGHCSEQNNPTQTNHQYPNSSLSCAIRPE